MYCEKCGAQLTGNAKFCENCGAPVILPGSRAEAPGAGPQEQQEGRIEGQQWEGRIEGRKITENIYLCPDGMYRWFYEFDMIRNPTILFTVWKVMFMAFAIVMVLINLINIASGDGLILPEWDDCKYAVLCFAILLGPLVVIAYLVVAASYGWRYVALFEMNEEGVNHRQMKSQFDKTKAMGWVAVMAGIATGHISTIGAGVLAATRDSMYSDFSKVKSVIPKRGAHVIKVNETLGRNQVYADGQDFDFVLDHIYRHTPQAKHG